MRNKLFYFLLMLMFSLMPATLLSAQEIDPSPQETDAAASDAAADDDDDSYAVEMEGEGLTVTGTRTPKRLRDSPVAIEVITAEEIENSGADTVVDVLDDYGIVYTGNGMGDYVQMQGLGKNRVLYLINGRRVSGRIAQRLKGETLPLANVERIEIIRGPQSALYGSDALGGVINIITKRAGDRIAFTSSITNRFLLAYDDPATAFSPGPFDGFDPVREQNLSAVLSFPVGISRNSLDLEAARGAFYLNETESASILPRYYRGRVGLDSSLTLTENLELRFGGSGMLMRRDDRTSERGSLNRLDYIRADGFVEAEWWAAESLMLNFRLYDNYYQRNRDAYNSILDSWTVGERFENDNIAALEVQGMFALSPKLVLTAGLDGAFNSMEKYNLSKDFVYVDREALFAQVEYFTADLFSVLGGVRVERNSQFGFAVSPKLSGMLHLGGGFRAFAGAGLGYRAPDFSDLYLVRDDEGGTAAPVYGNENLSPEYSLGFNLGIEYSRGIGFFQANAYYSELFDEISRIYVDDTVGGPYYLTRNISRSLRVGVDTEGKVSLPFHTFVSAGYSWLYAWDRSAGAEIYPQPNHTVKMKIGVDLPKPAIYAWVQGRFFSKFNDPARAGTEPRFILDFYFSVGLGKHFRLNFGVDNITGTMDRIGPETAQTFSVGLLFRL